MSDVQSSESDDDLIVLSAAIVALKHRIHAKKSPSRKPPRGGSRLGKLPNRERTRFDGAFKIDLDYHCRLTQNAGRCPVFNDAEFRRRLRVPQAVYEVLRRNILTWADSYFTERV
jgi:hypothetical protein